MAFEDKNNEDDEISIDFSKIKNIFKRKKKDKLEKDVKEIKGDLKQELKEKEEEIQELKEEEKDIERDIEKDKEEIKDLQRQEKKIEKIEEEIKDIEDDEVPLDFSKIKNIFKFGKKEKKGAESENIGANEEIEFDFSKIVKFFKTNKYVVPIVLILIAMFFSTFFRMYPAYLPITDTWARDTVYNYYKNQFRAEVNQQYLNLPEVNKNTLINNKFQEFLKNNKQQVNAQIRETSKQFKSRLQYTADNGKDYTYLLAIDPYLWYGYGKNYLECGHPGCDLREDGMYYNFRNGREGQIPRMMYISYFGVYIYKFFNLFSNIPLMQAFFLIPVIMIGFSVIPAFFIGKKVGGNLGGFFSAMIVAVNSALLGRTPGGFSDTDSANILFPLFIMWFFLEAFYAKDWKKTGIYSLLGGFSFYLYVKWWSVEHIFDFLLAAVAIYAGIILIKELVSNKSLNLPDLAGKLKIPLLKSVLFLGISLIFLILASSWNIIIQLYSSIAGFVLMKGVAVTTLWPNVLTTVAEFNEVPLNQIISQMGGRLLFAFAILGIVLSALKTDKEGKHYILYSVLITIWLLGTGYGFTKGIRFAILMVPAFAVAFGTGIGIIYQYLSKWLNKELKINKVLTNIILIVLLCLLLVSPIKAAHNTALHEIPSYNDAWDETLDAIKDDAEDGIGYLTTWWDFGHWFVAKGIRVTFDGGNQGERIHWVGKSLLTSDEDVSIGILRILNCGQEKAPHILEKYLDNDTVKAIDILNEIILENKEGAEKILQKEGLTEEEIGDVLAVTHCDDLLPQYYITSEDMIGKAGVWGHFGSWDFKRAAMYQGVKKKDYEEGINILINDFNLSEDQADQIYYEIQNEKADRWIAGWPGYLTGLAGCNIKDNKINCGNGVEVNLDTMDATISTQQGKAKLHSIVYINKDEEFVERRYADSKVPYSAALIPDGKGLRSILMDYRLAGSMFTRLFFFNGHGLKHFKPFGERRHITGGKIQVWKVDWESDEENKVFTKKINEEIKASHILICGEGDTNCKSNKTQEEALEAVTDLSKIVNVNNFAEMAEKYSDGPTGPLGGDLGWFGKGQMVKEFEEIAFELGIDEISEPVKTEFGWHIIMVTDKKQTEEELLGLINDKPKLNKADELNNLNES